MCIAILKPKGVELTEDTLRICASHNRDGCGLAYVDNGCVCFYKTLDLEKFLKKYHEVENKSNMILHFRIATHGEVCSANCHPFKLNNTMVLAHNGVITGYGNKKTKTDTQDFIDKVIGKFDPSIWDMEEFRLLVGNTIGCSKFVILSADDKYYIVNEDRGVWDNGIWFSNSSYKDYTKTKTKTVTTSSQVYDTPAESYYTRHWWDREDSEYNTNFRQLVKCKDCGKKYDISWSNCNPTCPSCKSDKFVSIGTRRYGVDHYYNNDESTPKQTKLLTTYKIGG